MKFKGSKFNWVLIKEEVHRRGGNSLIYLVHNDNDPDKEVFALKKFSKNDPERKKRFDKEIIIAKKLSKIDGCIDLLDDGYQKEVPFFVMPFYPKGNLFDYILSEAYPKDIVQILDCFLLILKIVKKAHEVPIALRDIKPQNIFLTHDYLPIIGDYGLSIDLNDSIDRLTKSQEAVGSQGYIAPELEQRLNTYEFLPVDIWSLGRTLWAMVAKKHAPNNFETLGSSNNHVSAYLEKNIANHTQGIITACTQQDPYNRPTIEELIELSEESRRFIVRTREDETIIQTDIADYLEQFDSQISHSQVFLDSERVDSEINIKMQQIEDARILLARYIEENYYPLIKNKVSKIGECIFIPDDIGQQKHRESKIDYSNNKKQSRSVMLRFQPSNKISTSIGMTYIYLAFSFGLTENNNFYWSVTSRDQTIQTNYLIEEVETKSIVSLIENKLNQIELFLTEHFLNQIEDHFKT